MLRLGYLSSLFFLIIESMARITTDPLVDGELNKIKRARLGLISGSIFLPSKHEITKTHQNKKAECPFLVLFSVLEFWWHSFLFKWRLRIN